MVRRRAIALSTWVVATAVSLALAWFAVSYAVADVADPIPTAIGHGTKDAPAQIAPALNLTRSFAVDAAGPPESTTTSTAVTATVSSGAPAAGTHDAGPAVAPATTAPAAEATPTPEQESGSPASAPTTTAPAATSTTSSFGSTGGTITVRCTGNTISLVSATPQSGYRTQVGDAGPQQVEVHFVSSTRDYELHAVCQNGQATAGAVDE